VSSEVALFVYRRIGIKTGVKTRLVSSIKLLFHCDGTSQVEYVGEQIYEIICIWKSGSSRMSKYTRNEEVCSSALAYMTELGKAYEASVGKREEKGAASKNFADGNENVRYRLCDCALAYTYSKSWYYKWFPWLKSLDVAYFINMRPITSVKGCRNIEHTIWRLWKNCNSSSWTFGLHKRTV
jgi:hypothetical protein